MKLFAILLFVFVAACAIGAAIVEAFYDYCCMAVRRARR